MHHRVRAYSHPRPVPVMPSCDNEEWLSEKKVLYTFHQSILHRGRINFSAQPARIWWWSPARDPVFFYARQQVADAACVVLWAVLYIGSHTHTHKHTESSGIPYTVHIDNCAQYMSVQDPFPIAICAVAKKKYYGCTTVHVQYSHVHIQTHTHTQRE